MSHQAVSIPSSPRLGLLRCPASLALGVLLVAGGSACATAHTATPTPHPMVASSLNTSPPRPTPPPVRAPAPKLDPNEPAGVLLESGITAFRNDEYQKAAAAFRAAIGTGQLNDAGRALAYWHIFVAERNLGHMNRSANALEGFVVVGQDVLDVREHLRYAVDASGDFVDRFDLKRRLARARATLSAAWLSHNLAFGRSAKTPIPVRTDAELSYFLEVAHPCAHMGDRSVSRRMLADTEQGKAVEQVVLSCGQTGQAQRYFFELPRAAAQ